MTTTIPRSIKKTTGDANKAFPHVLGAFDATRCDFVGRVLHPLEPDQSIEERYFPGWYNWLYPPPARLEGARKGAGLQIVTDQGQPALEWPTTLPCLLVRAENAWGDYEVETRVRQVMHACHELDFDETTYDKVGRCGIAFRMQHSRRHYFAGFEGGHKLVIGARIDHNIVTFNFERFTVDPDRYYTLRLRCVGERFELNVDGRLQMVATDDRWATGGAGVWTNVTARWRDASIRCSREEVKAIASRAARSIAIVKAASKQVPPAKIIARIEHVHAGYLPLTHVQLDQPCLVVSENKAEAIVAMDLQGKHRWRFSLSDGDSLASCAVHDVDRDGKSEVVVFTGSRIVLLDATNGRQLAEAPYPDGSPFIHMRGEKAKFNAKKPTIAHTNGRDKPARILAFEDTGAGTHTIWSFDHNLKLRWAHHQCFGKLGHALKYYDVNGDGREEIVAGYYALDDRGKYAWEMPDIDKIDKQEHADSFYVGPADPKNARRGPLRVVAACGEAGILVIDARTGQRLRQQRGLGHMQRVVSGNFAHDRAGVEHWMITDWGASGIFYLIDSEGNILNRFQDDPRCTDAFRLRWWPDGRDILFRNCKFGLCLYDAQGNRVQTLVDQEQPRFIHKPLAGHVVMPLLGNGAEQVIHTRDGVTTMYGADV